MRNIFVFAVMALIFTVVCSRVQAMFALDPDKDMKVIEKEVVNEDGTTSIVKEVIITKRPIVQGVEVPKTDGSQRNEKIQHARGWDRKLGKYKPQDPMFTVVTEKPKDWPIQAISRGAKNVPSAREEAVPPVLRWLVSAVCLGITVFAGLRIYLRMAEKTDPSTA